MFGISCILFVYMAGYSWYLGGLAINQSAPWLYSSAIVSGVSLFVLSILINSRRHKEISTPQRALLAFFDTGTYFCAVVLVLWGLVFPILRPIPSPDFQLYLLDQNSLELGLYTGLLLCSLVVVFRIALQFLIGRNPRTVMIIAAPPPSPVSQIVENAIPIANAKEEDTTDMKALENNLSLIRSEIAMLREQISWLSSGSSFTKSPEFAASADMPNDNLGFRIVGEDEAISTPPQSTAPILQAPPSASVIQGVTGAETLPSNVGLQSTQSVAPDNPQPADGIQLPDAAKDNPWISVLSLRQTKAPAKPSPQKKTSAAKRTRKGGSKKTSTARVAAPPQSPEKENSELSPPPAPMPFDDEKHDIKSDVT